MKTKVEIENQMHQFRGKLEELEHQRLQVMKKYSTEKMLLVIAAIVLLFSGIIATIMLLNSEKNYLDYVYWLFVPFVLCTSTYIGFNEIRSKMFLPIKREYKTGVVEKLIREINPNLSYQPDQGISGKTFRATRFFPDAIDFIGTDLVQGKIQGGSFLLSLVHYSTRIKYSEKRTEIVTVFSGGYSIMDLKNTVTEPVCIKLITDQVPFNSSTIYSNLKPTASGNAEFDAMYKLYCKDPNEIREFVDSQLFKVLMDFSKRQENPVEYYLNKNELHVALRGIDLDGISINKPIPEADCTLKFANCVNDLNDLADRVTNAIPAILKTE